MYVAMCVVLHHVLCSVVISRLLGNFVTIGIGRF